MRAAELYKVLNAELGPWFKQAGFKRMRKSRFGYERLADGRVDTVSFQCDKWGWDAYAGSSFFVNFGVADGSGARVREERLNFFLTDPELEEARAYHDEVVARIPKPPDAYWAEMKASFARYSSDAEGLAAALQAAFEPAPRPFRRHQDFALRYWQAGDIIGWAWYLLRVLPRATGEMTTWTGRERRR